MSVTPSVLIQVVPNALKADSKSETIAMRMLIATITKGNALNHSALPSLPQRYFNAMKPMQPIVAA